VTTPNPKLLVACLARNEADRFWRSALEAWSSFADLVLVVDDGSTDATSAIAREFPRSIVQKRHSVDPAAWGRESPARQQLFDLSLYHTSPGDYILWLDADMVPASDPRPLMNGGSAAWSFPLYDLWGPGVYREDAYWFGHFSPRVWMIRRPEPQDWTWSGRGIHSGHLPSNFSFRAGDCIGIAPYDMGLLHFAYVDAELRAEKYQRYMSVRDQLSDGERKHAETIMDPHPHLVPLYFTPQYWLEKAPQPRDNAA
jgi:glycosyltransferase involved in cell wall biosynthesis